MWTRFMDMHSGGGSKEPFEYIYIEAPEDEAKVIFYNRFGHNPERVTCTCCGDDYSISDDDSLERLTYYERGAEYAERNKPWVEKPSSRSYGRPHLTLEQYLETDQVKVIRSEEITQEERVGSVPRQGYIWRD